MSKARLVITAVTVEMRSAGEVARSYGVARSWVYALLARYAAEGEAASGPRYKIGTRLLSVVARAAKDLIILHASAIFSS